MNQQYVYGKGFSISYYQGNVKQNNNKITALTSENKINEKSETRIGEDALKMKSLFTVGRNVSVSTKKMYGNFLKK